MSRKRKSLEERKENLSLRIRGKTLRDYKKFVKEKGEFVSPRIEKLMEKDMLENEKQEK